MLKFPDNTKVSVIGLDDIMAEFYAKNRTATVETAEEIIKRLEATKNYLPSSERAHREYVYVLLNEYRKYSRDRTERGR